ASKYCLIQKKCDSKHHLMHRILNDMDPFKSRGSSPRVILDNTKVIRDDTRCDHWGRIGGICPSCGVKLVAAAATDEMFILEAMALVSTLVLNILDVMLTLGGLDKGILLEANPLLAPFVSIPWLFVTVKLGLVIIGLLVLWMLRDHKWVLPASFGLFVVYGC